MLLRHVIPATLMLMASGVSGQTGVAAAPLDSPQARRAAVEVSLLSQPWVEGHGFSMAERMRILEVPGVSVAVIHDGQIDWAAGYGVRDEVTGEPVTAETMFQAASISKSVSAMAVMRLAQEGRLDLDAPIEDILESYELPPSRFDGVVTPRRILSHSAGLNVHGFGGYRPGETIPTAAQVVAGLGNSDQLERIEDVGTRYRYSGGGSTLLQVAMMDLLGEDFDSIVRARVLEPLGMTRSTFEQPIDGQAWPDRSAGHDDSGRQVLGGVHIYPEQFAAGLWTTPTDLARFALEIQRVAASQDGQVLDVETGHDMLTPVLGPAALGLFISDRGGELWFGHSGSNQGFKCDLRASFRGGHGVVVMTNGELGGELMDEVVRAVAQVYEWPDDLGEPLTKAPLTPAQRQRYEGRYAFSPDEVVFIRPVDERLTIQQLPYPRLPLVPLGDHRFHLLGTEFQVEFQVASTGSAASLSLSMDAYNHAEKLADDAYAPVEDLLFGDAQAAIAHYCAVYAADETDPVVAGERLSMLASSLRKLGRPAAAHVLARTVTEFHPDDAGAWNALAQTCVERGDHDAAVAALRTCLERIPDDASLDDRRREWLQGNATARLRWLER